MGFLPYILKISNQAPIVFFAIVSFLIGVIFRFVFYQLSYVFFAGFFAFTLWSWYDYVRYDLMKYFEKTSVPKFDEDLTPIEIMRRRISNRAYMRRYLTKDHEEYVKKLVSELEIPDDIKIHYVKKAFRRCTFITDAWQFLICTIPKKYNDDHLVLVGRNLEGIILNCTKVGIATCWVGGFRSGDVYTSVPHFRPKEDHIAVLVAMGYRSKYIPYAIQWSYGFSRKRKKYSEIFFENEFGTPMNLTSSEENNEKMKILIEATRNSPTASNAQDVRIVRIEDDFHFYKVGPSEYYAIMNTGIYMKNWENACIYLGMTGEFVKDDPKLDIDEEVNAKYMCTWKI